MQTIGLETMGLEMANVRGQEAWEYHEPGAPPSRDPSHVPICAGLRDSVSALLERARVEFWSPRRSLLLGHVLSLDGRSRCDSDKR